MNKPALNRVVSWIVTPGASEYTKLSFSYVIPAKAGIQAIKFVLCDKAFLLCFFWIPAFAGMTSFFIFCLNLKLIYYRIISIKLGRV